MVKIIQVAIEMSDRETIKEISRVLDGITGVKTTFWYEHTGEKGELAAKESPDILIIDDKPGGAGFFERLRAIRQNFPHTAIFVASTEKDPQQIVRVMKAGAKEYLMLPLHDKDLVGAVDEVRQTLGDSDRGTNRANVYSLISSKGGLGSTVLAVNVAAALAGQNKPGEVALCDTSFQSGDSSVMLDLVPQTSILDLSKNIHRLDQALLKGVMARHSCGMDLMAAPTLLEDTEEITPDKYEKILALLRRHYSDIVIDCSSMRVDQVTLHSFNISKKIFINIDLSIPAIRNAVRLATVMRQFGVPDEKIYFVVNRFARSNLYSLAEAERNISKRVYWLFPNDYEEIIASINEGVPMVNFRTHSAFSKNIHAFIDKINGKARNLEYRGASSAFGRPL